MTNNPQPARVSEAWQQICNRFSRGFIDNSIVYNQCRLCWKYAEQWERIKHTKDCPLPVISALLAVGGDTESAARANPAPSYDLKALREAATEACRKQLETRHLFCVSAESVRDDAGDTYYRVWLESASPDDAEVHKLIHSELRKAKYRKIEVRTQW
jgi:hypothetical protein